MNIRSMRHLLCTWHLLCMWHLLRMRMPARVGVADGAGAIDITSVKMIDGVQQRASWRDGRGSWNRNFLNISEFITRGPTGGDEPCNWVTCFLHQRSQESLS